MRAILLLLALAAPTVCLAQTTAVIAPSRHLPAPWWMDQPVIASSGLYEIEALANRASFTATVANVDKSLEKATRMTSGQVRTLSKQLEAFGADKARVELNFGVEPIYDQYRDRAGQLIANERADKIERYKVEIEISVEVLDLSVLEQVYATVLAANPSDATEVEFRLEPDNAMTTDLYRLAVADSRRRAVLSVEATGARLGPIKLIDPSGRSCQTDLLVAGQTVASASMQSSMVRKRSSVTAVDSIIAEDIATMRAEVLRVPIQPPLITLSKAACVVYSLSG